MPQTNTPTPPLLERARTQVNKKFREAGPLLRRELNGLTVGSTGLPSVLVIGAQKSGTSALYEYLTHHPRIYAARKEVNFFKFHYGKGERWYRRQFPAGPGVKVDASPGYFYHGEVPARAAAVLPWNTIVIALLRDPVRRAFSAWNMYRQVSTREKYVTGFRHTQRTDPTMRFYDEYCAGPFPNFAEAVERELAWIEADAPIREPSLLRRGFYREQIERWLKHFPRENFLFVDSADLKREEFTRQFLRRLAATLGLDPAGFDDLPFELVHARAYESVLPPALEERLDAVFRERNRGLNELTGLDLAWNR